jgi:hypothetical protein
MHDIVVNVETTIPFQALNRINGDTKIGARLSIKRQSTGKWWDGNTDTWVDSISYNSMTHIAHGDHEYLMTFPYTGEYKLLFTHADGYMVNDSYIVTVYPEERIVESDVATTLRGPGADEGTVTVLDGNGDPVADADVWVSTDEDGLLVIAGTLQSNSEGKSTFWLDEGVTYYIWGQKDGRNFDNPTEVVW